MVERPVKADGMRVLVDDPGIPFQKQLAVDTWLKSLAPSKELKLWFQNNPDAWMEFRKRYLKELRAAAADAALNELQKLAAQKKPLTLLFASPMEAHNNAEILRDVLEGIRKPPTGTGRAGLRLVQHRIAKRLPIS